MLEPYLDGCGCRDRQPRPRASSTRRRCAEYVTELDAAGFQVHFHALGDRAVREALDAVEAARERERPERRPAPPRPPAGGRTPTTSRGSRELGATANIQPLWAAHEPQMDELTIPFLGERRSAWQYPFGDLAAAGAHLAGGQRLAGEQPRPARRACTSRSTAVAPRRERRRGGAAVTRATGSTSATALTAYTAGSAWVNHLDDRTGRLAAGLLADLAVLDRDPFAGPPEEIGTARVVATYLAGETVFRAS